MLFIIHLTFDNWQSKIAKPSEGGLDEFLASNSIQRVKVLGEVHAIRKSRAHQTGGSSSVFAYIIGPTGLQSC